MAILDHAISPALKLQALQRYFSRAELVDSRQQGLLDVSTHLFPRHNDHQLGGQFNQTASWVALGQGDQSQRGASQGLGAHKPLYRRRNRYFTRSGKPSAGGTGGKKPTPTPSFLWKNAASTTFRITQNEMLVGKGLKQIRISPPRSSACSIYQTCMCNHQGNPRICL